MTSVRCSSRGVSDVASNGTTLSVKDSESWEVDKYYSENEHTAEQSDDYLLVSNWLLIW